MITTFWKLWITSTFVCTLVIVTKATFEEYGAKLGHVYNSKLERDWFSWFIADAHGSSH